MLIYGITRARSKVLTSLVKWLPRYLTHNVWSKEDDYNKTRNVTIIQHIVTYSTHMWFLFIHVNFNFMFSVLIYVLNYVLTSGMCMIILLRVFNALCYFAFSWTVTFRDMYEWVQNSIGAWSALTESRSIRPSHKRLVFLITMLDAGFDDKVLHDGPITNRVII